MKKLTVCNTAKVRSRRIHKHYLLFYDSGIHSHSSKMFSIRNFFSMVVLLAISSRIANAFKTSSSRWMRVNALSAATDAVPAAPTGERINKLMDLESPKVVSPIALNAGEKCVVCRCWKR